MPYESNAELPKGIRSVLPSAAQTLFRKAFNSADKRYPEARAMRIAWAAVKNAGYRKGSDGKWVKQANPLERALLKAFAEKARELNIDEEDLGGLTGPHARAAAKFWKENWWRMVSRPGHGSYVLHHHWRGLLDTETDKDDEWLWENTKHSIHEDLRHAAAEDWSGEKSSANLFGFAAFLEVEDLREAKGPVLTVLGTDRASQEAYQLAPKLPQPKGWLSIGRQRPVVFEPRGTGATTKKYAKIFAVDWGEYHVGVCREHSFEIFYTSAAEPKGMLGRYLILLIETPEGRRWNIKKPDDQTPIAERKKPEDYFEELKEKGQKYLVWSDGKSKPVLYDVQRERAVTEKVFKVHILKQKMEKGLVYGEVLVPDEVDAQGEVVSAEDIEAAAHDYLKGSRRLDYKHTRLLKDEEAVVVESYIAPVSFEWEDRHVEAGTWLMVVKVFSEALKKEIETHELNSFSIRGFAGKRKEVKYTA